MKDTVLKGRSYDIARNIESVEFGIYSNREVERNSVLRDNPYGITNNQIYSNGEPVQGGIVDKRMGVADKGKCETCGDPRKTCPTHHGHARLAVPIIHDLFADIMKNVLRCLCIRCNKLLAYGMDAEIEKIVRLTHGKQRFNAVKKLCKTVSHCRREGCGVPAHKIKKDNKEGYSIILAEPVKKASDDNNPDKRKHEPQELSPQLCYDKLRNISREDLITLGFDPERAKPADMIITNFIIPPIAIRPYIKSDSMSPTANDGLTNQLVDFIKINENLRNVQGSGSLTKASDSLNDYKLLQIHHATFLSNDGAVTSQQRNRKKTVGLGDRLKNKQGRFRNNLMGKRCNFTARSVVSPDPFIKLEDVGIPLNFAVKLTYPEIVTPYNIDYLQSLVNNGPNKYPGANFVSRNITDRNTGKTMEKQYSLAIKTSFKLAIGDRVARHLQDSDIVLFNRQPSLHKGSLMGQTGHIINDFRYNTLRMNVNVTEPYNADFDGDELNLHVPQSIQSVCELHLLTKATRHIINPTNSKVVIKPKQDTIMGAFVLTYDHVKVDWKVAMNILMATSLGISTKIPKGKYVSGKYLLSCIFPKDLNITREDKVKIINGVLLKGQIGGTDMAPIIQKILFQYGPVETRNFIDNLQRMILLFLMKFGFTVGIKDCVLPKSVLQSAHNTIETTRKKLVSDITRYENNPYSMTSEAFETQQREELSAGLRGRIEDLVMANIDKTSGIYLTITSGSSGATANAAQITTSVGQIIVEEKRIQPRFNNRTLPTFPQFDDSPFARGYCANSFISGLNVNETFFGCAAGREGIIYTNIKTAETGYTQRKLVKAEEDYNVQNDGTVRNSNGKILQFVYGDNGIDAAKQVEQRIAILTAGNKTVAEKYIYSEAELKTIKGKYSAKLNSDLHAKLLAMRDKMRAIALKLSRRPGEFRDKYPMPFDLEYWITCIRNKPNRKTDKTVDPYLVLVEINKAYKKNNKVIWHTDKSIVKKRDDQTIKFLFKLFLYDMLAPKRCTHEYKLSEQEFMTIVKRINEKFYWSLVEPGEMVGMLAALAKGEPLSQANLKTFHKSGLGSTVSGGLSRILEIINVTENQKTPILNIELTPEYQNDKRMADLIAASLKYTLFKDIVEKAEIIYDPEAVITKADKATNVFAEKRNKSGCIAEYDSLPWLLKITLSKELLYEHKITLMEIKASFCYNWSNRNEQAKTVLKEYRNIIGKITQCSITSNHDNSEVPMIHIRFDGNYDTSTMMAFLKMVIEGYRIKGITGFNGVVAVTPTKYIAFNKEGEKVQKERYTIYVDGVNFRDIARIKGIDLKNVKSNDIVSVYRMYGIEAARSLILREVAEAFDSATIFSNYQHYSMLADVMTHTEELTSINRHGTNKLDTDPFTRASFEQSVEQLVEAAAFAETDRVKSTSSKVTVGSVVRGGTGMCDVIVDFDKITSVLEPTPAQATATLVQKKTSVADLFKRKRV